VCRSIYRGKTLTLIDLDGELALGSGTAPARGIGSVEEFLRPGSSRSRVSSRPDQEFSL
jgi:hypothetical protein